MKIYASKQGTQISNYKNIPIYLDDISVYIYTEDKGKGQLRFDNENEAREYIDDMFIDDDSYPVFHNYRVKYLSSGYGYGCIDVKAENEKSARYKVSNMDDLDCYKITDVYEI